MLPLCLSFLPQLHAAASPAAAHLHAPGPAPQLLMSKTLGGAPNNKALIALSSVTKSFVDDLVATGGLCVCVCWRGGGGGD